MDQLETVELDTSNFKLRDSISRKRLVPAAKMHQELQKSVH
jgi:hypothetical protein